MGKAGRFLPYTVLLAIVLVAIAFVPQLPDRRPGELLVPAGPPWKISVDTLTRVENLRSLLRNSGLSDSSSARAARLVGSLTHHVTAKPLEVRLRSIPADSAPSSLVLQVSVDHVLHLQRYGDTWTGINDSIPWKTDTVVINGAVESNLVAAMDAGARDVFPASARQRLTELVADVFEYRVDMSKDVQRGDHFKLLAERSVAPNGTVKMGNLLAARFDLSGTIVRAVRFASNKVTGEFFDPDGKSMRAAFLHAPLQFKRISSVFGMRLHPILGDERMHEGMDYAAPSGTTVRAVGDGIVTRAGWGNGYGNVIEIRHNNGFVTRYGHLRNFAPGIHTGVHVSIGQTIAFVGSTGLATGPHLHFEVLVNGVQRDPRSALSKAAGDPVPQVERGKFVVTRDHLLTMLDSTNVLAAAAIGQH